MSSTPTPDYESLHDAIASGRKDLSNRLKRIANFALEHPTTMGIEKIANIAENAGVQPSALIRFAKAFGYSGFSDMQQVFQRYVTDQSESYKERVARELAESSLDDPDSLQSLFKQYCDANIISIKLLQQGIDPADIDQAVQLLRSAQHIYIIGQRRSLAVATYFVYTLSHTGCRAHLIDGSGGLLMEQAQAMSKDDLLVAISFHPYSTDTNRVVSAAVERQVPIVSISDSSLSPNSENASVSFSVHDAEVHNFRSLSATMLLAQTLATGLAFEHVQPKRPKQ